ncbi:MAG TPA: PH domain-containing protein [Propionicimonas sp.]|nr:PH domain-containing protein [Propionicimonas sp.]
MAPLVLRPRRALLTASVLSAVLLAATVVGWVAMPVQTRDLFTPPQLLTLGFFVLVMIGFMMSVGLSVVRADDDGLTFRNGLRTHHLDWDQVAGFRFTENDPWAYVLTDDDPDQRPLLGLQRTDHERAEAALVALESAWRQARA